MEPLKPRFTQEAYRRALKEYGEDPHRIIEELVANSYDADSSSVIVAHDINTIIIADNGTGIDDEQFSKMLDLGSGTKSIDVHKSEKNRSFLGSFGFGFKSIINITKCTTIFSINNKNIISVDIDISELEKYGFKENSDWEGFIPNVNKNKNKNITGTMIILTLSKSLNPKNVADIKKSLSNLPISADFSIYLSEMRHLGNNFLKNKYSTIENINKNIVKLKDSKITNGIIIGSKSVKKVPLIGKDKMDVEVWCNGLDNNMKVESLGPFAGVYIKVNGRVLKKNFHGEKVVQDVSKFAKFRHGIRIEVPMDWADKQINLGRDGLIFSNESIKSKFDSELGAAVRAAITPLAKQLQNKKLAKLEKEIKLREKRAKERIEKKLLIASLSKTGYAFEPDNDYEMALIISNPTILSRLNSSWMLMDFNGQSDFDCLIYNRSSREFIHVELEPKLDRFLNQGVTENTEVIIAWSRGDWNLGKRKKGKGGYFQLMKDKNSEFHYRLLLFSTIKSKEPKCEFGCYCIEEVVRQLK